jgi:hypothetical protein
MLRTPGGAAVTGMVTLSPVQSLPQGLTSTFYLDNQVKLISALSQPELRVDTTKLGEGVHEVRLDIADGTQLAFSTGGVPLQVLSSATANLLGQEKPQEMAFNKVYRKIIHREAVWFDNREADLEKHAIGKSGHLEITLTDLLRHVGGNIIWGPSRDFVLVERNKLHLRFIPGTATVYVDGKRMSLGERTTRIDSRLFVPVGPVVALLGLKSQWNTIHHRLDVNTRH